jgi:hypothetical protein
MADYFTPTVVEPPLPLADMTQLEKLVLGAVFETRETDTGLHCHAWEGVNDCPSLPITALRDAWAQAEGTPSRLHDRVTKQLVAMLITAEEIISESTTGLLEKWLADAFP